MSLHLFKIIVMLFAIYYHLRPRECKKFGATCSEVVVLRNYVMTMVVIVTICKAQLNDPTCFIFSI